MAGLRDKPAGRVRLLMPRTAALTVLAPKLARFARDYPDVVLDVTTDNSRLDLVAAGFDAGIQLGEFIAQDMVAVRVSPDHRAAIVGSPRYFESNPRPKSPRDLTRPSLHQLPARQRRHLSMGVRQGQAVARRRGDGTADHRRHRDRGRRGDRRRGPRVHRGGRTWRRTWRAPRSCAFSRTGARRLPGYFLYYPSRRQQPAALSALIETLRM